MAWGMGSTSQQLKENLYGSTPFEVANEFRRLGLELRLRDRGFDVQGGAIVLPGPPAYTERAPADPEAALRVIRVALASLQMALVVFLGWMLLFNFSIVRGQSMRPGIQDGDRILIDRFSYMFTPVERGDIVVLGYPLDPNLDYIKRIIGVPGDEVQIRAGEVFVNGAAMREPYVADLDPTSYFTAHVEPGHYFVLGDNRSHSSDSREFGQVHEELLKGKVDVRLWPPTRVGLLE
jgi:signal peptidase I